jgi:hypothetical protein
MGSSNLLSGYADADWGNTAINVWYAHPVQQCADHVEVEDV